MKKSLFTLFLVLAVMVSLGSVQAANQPFKEDVHYNEVIPEQPGGEGERVVVMEFFWYGCPHCYTLEPHLEKWLETKPDSVDFIRFPALLSGSNRILHGKTYYALKMMGLGESLHEKIFAAMHEQKKPLGTQKEMESFLEGHGVNVDEFRKLMNSNGVKLPVKRAAKLADKYNVHGVPAIIVDGKYSTGGISGHTMMEVTDYLIDRVRAERKDQ